MVDLRADTASSSDKTEFTETEDQSRTHQCRRVYRVTQLTGVTRVYTVCLAVTK